MNIIDIIVLGVLAVCVVVGMYRGFIQTVLNLGAGLLSFVGAFLLYPKLADVLSSNTDITRAISSYTDSSSILGSLDLSSKAVNALDPQSIQQVVERANLPDPLGTLLKHNLNERVFSPLGNLATNVGDYVNQTILSVSVNVICFILCFAAIFIIASIIINMLRAVFRYPVLKHLDGLVGGVMGLLVGVLICFVFFTVMPIVEGMVPLPEFRELVEQSRLAGFFTNGGLIVSIMNRKL